MKLLNKDTGAPIISILPKSLYSYLMTFLVYCSVIFTETISSGSKELYILIPSRSIGALSILLMVAPRELIIAFINCASPSAALAGSLKVMKILIGEMISSLKKT